MIKQLVIADDLTGALDTAVHFAERRLSVLVLTDPAAFGTAPGCEVLVIDTESRHLPPREAGKRVSRAVELGVRAGALYFYKKIDSTLRGNIGAELAALLNGGLGNELMLAPAFPGLRRTVVNGRLYLDGIPVADTCMSRDPLDPVTTSDIPEIIARQTEIPVHLVGDPREMPRSRGSEQVIFLFDTVTDADLDRIAGHLAAQDRLHLAAGSAGFARALADSAYGVPRPTEAPLGHLPMLVISGSQHEVSRRQIDHAARRGWPLLRLDPRDLADRDGSPNLRRLKDEAVTLLQGGRSLIVEIKTIEPPSGDIGGRGSPALASSLGCFVKDIIDTGGLPTLVIFGGDTAFGVLNALRIKRLVPRGEVEPGIVSVCTIDEQYQLHLITKAGGFGQDDLISKIESRLGGG